MEDDDLDFDPRAKIADGPVYGIFELTMRSAFVFAKNYMNNRMEGEMIEWTIRTVEGYDGIVTIKEYLEFTNKAR